MFDLFRSRTKAVKYLLGALLMLVAISMVITLIPGFTGMQPENTQVLAEIGDEQITILEVQQNIQSMMRNRQMPREMLGMFVPQMINDMINNKALAYEAKRLGFRVTEEDVANEIRSMAPVLFPNGQFVGREVYANILAQQNLTIEQFERRVREDLLAGKLRALVSEGVFASPAEIEQAFKRKEEKIKLNYVALTPEQFQSAVTLTPDEVKAAYEAQKNSLLIPERRSFDLLLVEESKVAANVTFTEADLRRAYQQNQDRFREDERVKVRHILLNTSGKSEAEVKQIEAKAADLLKQLKAGADFAELAKKHSEDPGSASRGGDLDWISRGQTVPNFEQTAFTLAPGQLSDLVKTEYGFHIIQVQEKRPAGVRPFEQVRAELERELKQQAVSRAMEQLIDQARALLLQNPTQAREIAQKLNLTHAAVVGREPGQPFPLVGGSAVVDQAVMSLKKNEVSAPLDIAPDRMGLVVMTDIQPMRPGEFAEVEDRVRRTLLEQKAAKLMEERALELLAKAREQGNNLAAAARAMKLEVKTTQEFNRDGAADGIGAASIVADGFDLDKGAVFGPISAGNQRLVCQVAEKIPADMSRFPAERAAVVQEIKASKSRLKFDLFQDAVRNKLVKDGKLKVNEALMDRFTKSFAS